MWDLKDHLMFEITVCLTDRMITTFHFDNELVKNLENIQQEVA